VCATLAYVLNNKPEPKWSIPEEQRQSVLESILTEPFFKSSSKYVEGITYDRGFRAQLAYVDTIANNSANEQLRQAALDDARRTRIAISYNQGADTQVDAMTTVLGLKMFAQQKSHIYASETAFEADSLDDVRTTMHHEIIHAKVNYSGLELSAAETVKLQQKGLKGIPQEVLADGPLWVALMEAPAYFHQLRVVDAGTFQVQPAKYQRYKNVLNQVVTVLREYASQDEAKGWFAQAMLRSTVDAPK